MMYSMLMLSELPGSITAGSEMLARLNQWRHGFLTSLLMFTAVIDSACVPELTREKTATGLFRV